MAAPEAFVPELPVSVVVPYYAQPEELGRTLAALEGQTYPRELFEVVVVRRRLAGGVWSGRGRRRWT